MDPDPNRRLPRPQTYDLQKIIAGRDRLVDIILLDFHGFTPTGAHFEELIRRMSRAANTPYETTYASFMHLAGQLLTRERLKAAAWHLFGNQRRIAKGTPVPPWAGQRKAEWVPVNIMSMEVDNGDRRVYYVYRMLVLAGTPTAMYVTARWTSKVAFLAARRLGFTQSRGDRPFRDVSELVNLRLRVLLEPEYSTQTTPGFKQLSCSGSLLGYNLEVLDMRRRILGGQAWPCPQGYNHLCYRCHVGYHDCPAATHPNTIQLGVSEHAAVPATQLQSEPS